MTGHLHGHRHTGRDKASGVGAVVTRAELSVHRLHGVHLGGRRARRVTRVAAQADRVVRVAGGVCGMRRRVVMVHEGVGGRLLLQTLVGVGGHVVGHAVRRHSHRSAGGEERQQSTKLSYDDHRENK